MLIRDVLGMVVKTHPRPSVPPVKDKVYLVESIEVHDAVVLVNQYYLAKYESNNKLYIFNELHVLTRNKGIEVGYTCMMLTLSPHICVKGRRLSDFVAEKLWMIFDTLY
jgi:hypothetical protein